MSELRVDPSSLDREANAVLDHSDVSRREHSTHDDDLLEVAEKWNGEIAGALAHVADAWAQNRAALHQRVSKLGVGMSEAAIQYCAADKSSETVIDRTAEAL
ncbi:hypothetical protein [Mycolicibacterium lutetiense]|uniref:WXG100 family type VII secretion target n=1 Tax=Mycolicibacterium lutetiense TaxID=1641992 RepID=A0ABS4ZU35_9MYCO|nr:hypothetical protein [Mycolicibacterium lutetiense]MBP2453004.1 hypothetical protein [Mycolicibacterium lutetiense]